MTDERKVQLGVEVDSTGARKGFEEVTRTAKKAAADVAQAVKPASQAVDGIGAGGAAAAQKVDRATQSMIASIQRTTAAAEAGERGTAKYFETLAARRGISSDALRPYLQQLDAARAKQDQATSSLDKMGAAASFVRSALGGMVAAFSVSAIVAWANGVISAASALDDLADATGSSVSELSKLSNIAYVSGASFSTIDAAIKKLSVGMAGVDDETGKAGKALALLGVQSRDPAQALTEIARKFAEYQDGANKAALAVAIFGRQGASLLPVLKDIAENLDIAGTVTAKQAADAEALEKAWRRLALESTTLKNALLTDIVPALTDVAVGFNEAKKAGLGFIDSVLLGGLAGYQDATGITKAVSNAKAALKDLQDSADKYKGWAAKPFWAPSEQDIAKAEARLNALLALQRRFNQAALDADPNSDLAARSGGRGQAPTIPGGNEAKVQVADYADEIAKLNDELLRLTGADGGYTRFAAAWRQFTADVRAGKSVNTEQTVAFLNAAKAVDDQAKAIKESTAAWEAYERQVKTAADDAAKIADATLAANKAIKEQNDELRLEHATLGMTTTERARYVVQMKLAAAVAREDANAIALLTEQLDLLSQQAADNAALKASEAWKQAADSISTSLTDALLRGFEDGKSFAKNFVDTLYNMFRTLILRPVIQAIVSPVAGGITGALGFAGNAAASGGGSLLSAGGSLLGGLGAFGGGFSGALTNIGVEGLVGGTMTNFAGIAGSLGAGNVMGALGLAMPYVGAAVAIGMLVKGILSSNRGGPKSGGFGTSGLIGALSGADNGRWFTPNSADAQVTQLASTVGKTFRDTLVALGGTGVGGFAFGFDSDPQGDAPNRLHAGAFVNGMQVYDSPLSDLGRDDATLQAALELESKRALLAALQASDLPAQIAAVFDSVNAASAGATTIDNLMAFGSAMKVVIDAIGGDVVADAQAAWERSQRSSVQVLNDMGAEVIRLATNMDGTVGSMQALATATTEYRSAVVQTLVAIKQIAAEMATLFDGTRTSLTTFGMSPEQLYNFYRTDADAAMAELSSTNDPARVAVLAQRINADINAAFGALPEEAKTGQQNPLLAYLNGVDAYVQTRLATISSGISSSTTDPFAAANAALDGAASRFVSAADNSVTASNTALEAAKMNLQAAQLNLQAAQTPVRVELAGTEV